MERTPPACWRVAVAWPLGRIGDRQAVPVLQDITKGLNNASDARHAAAGARQAIEEPASLAIAEALAVDYLDIATHKVPRRQPTRFLDDGDPKARVGRDPQAERPVGRGP